jgi:acyl phosphate:glycerol-3-phosphate acyltransferase
MAIETVVVILLTSYLIGSFPTAYIICRLQGINIFEIGSGNMGTTNTVRALGYGWGLAVYILDVLKGVGAMLLARLFVPGEDGSAAMIVSAIAVVTGHNWSIFASLLTGRIRGGKGAATASGTWLLLAPPVLWPVALMVWATIVAVTRYMSLAVLTCVALASITIIFIRNDDPIYLLYIMVPLMIFYKFRTNIKAIASGTERRFGERA